MLHTFLDKDADYGAATIDASFYALNFAQHRLTAALTARLGRGFEVRVDNEFRMQEENLLRVVGGDNAVLSSVGLQLRGDDPAAMKDFVVSVHERAAAQGAAAQAVGLDGGLDVVLGHKY